MAFLRPAISISVTTSNTCERPLESHRIRLLAPAALPSITTCVGEVASVSTAAGLLESTRVSGVCTLMTIDFPTNTCTVSPSAGAAVWGAVCPAMERVPITRRKNAVLAIFELIIWSPVLFGLHQICGPCAGCLESLPAHKSVCWGTRLSVSRSSSAGRVASPRQPTGRYGWDEGRHSSCRCHSAGQTGWCPEYWQVAISASHRD